MYDSSNIEEVINKRKIDGKYQYIINWKEYTKKNSSLEPNETLKSIKNLIKIYDNLKENNIPIIVLDEDENNCSSQKEEKIENKNILENNENKNKLINNDKKIDFMNIPPFYMIDKSIEKIVSIRKEKGILVAIIEIREKNGKIKREKVKADVLKINNPWILIDYYESRAKFSSKY